MSWCPSPSLRGNAARTQSVSEVTSEVVSNLQSARIKLATFKVRDKLEHFDHLDDIREKLEAHQLVDSDLQALIALEQSNLPQVEEEGANKIISCDLIAKSSSNLHKEFRQKTFAQVQKSLEQLEDTFSLILRAILVVSGFQVPNSPLEQDKLCRRSREFEIRLKRNAFEAKQQLIVLRSHIVQIVVHPNNKKLSSKTIGKLIRMLRSLNLIWQSYLNHLPLSGGHLYPKALEQVLSISKVGMKVVNELGYDVLEIDNDLDRLTQNYNKYQEKLLRLDPKPKELTSLRPVKCEMSLLEKKRRQSLKMIDNLARQKFGSPCKQGSLHSKERPYSVQSFRSALATPFDRKMLNHAQVENSLEAPELSKPSRPVSTAKSGKTSVKSSSHNQPQSISSIIKEELWYQEPNNAQKIENSLLDRFSKRPESVASVSHIENIKSRESDNMGTKVSQEHTKRSENVHSSFNTSNGTVKNVIEEPNIYPPFARDPSSSYRHLIHHENVIMPDIHWHNIATTSISMPRSPIDQNKIGNIDSLIVNKVAPTLTNDSSPAKNINRKVSKVELSDAALHKILSQKRRLEQKESDDNFDLFEFQSVQVVTNLSCKLADEILDSICREMIDSDLISQLISSELKG